MGIYIIKRFSSSYYSPRKYENTDREEFEYDLDSARRGRENLAIDEEADLIRWRSSLKKHKSSKGKTAAALGGPGGLAGKWVGDTVAEAADAAGKTDEEIKEASNAAATIAGAGAGIAAGYGIKHLMTPAEANIAEATKELKHLESYRHDIPKFTKMSKAEKANITEGIKRQQAIIRANTRKAQVGRYAMPVLGAVGAIGAAKAINDSLNDRLNKRRAIDPKMRRKGERRDRIDEFKDNVKGGVSSAASSIKRGVKRLTQRKKKSDSED
jgi:hypothetical protein